VKARTVALVVAGLVVAGGVRGPADENGAVAFKVIVHPSVTGQKISRDVVAEIYLGKVARWADGRHIMPVDLSSTSAVREAFSNAVLGLRVEEVKNHWLKSASQGRRPPLTKASDEEMIAAVAAEAGAIGYVSAPAPLPATVREVRVE
jgi:ABC-type phosphate transport system substrate-binding protein